MCDEFRKIWDNYPNEMNEGLIVRYIYNFLKSMIIQDRKAMLKKQKAVKPVKHGTASMKV